MRHQIRITNTTYYLDLDIYVYDINYNSFENSLTNLQTFVCNCTWHIDSVRQGKANTLASNHFHSVKKKIKFLSARPRDLDGMLGTGLLVSMYTTKAPIDMWRFNVPQLKEFFVFSVKDRYQLNYFICVKDFNGLNVFSFFISCR